MATTPTKKSAGKKHAGGRPKKAPEDRLAPLFFRVEPADRKRIELAAAEQHLAPSVFVRQIVLRWLDARG